MPKVPKVTLTCHPEAKPKDLANEKEILRFAQNDSFAVTLAHFSSLEPRFCLADTIYDIRNTTPVLSAVEGYEIC